MRDDGLDAGLLAEVWDRRYRGGIYEAAPPLDEVKAFVQERLAALGPADWILDLGCGNGRHLRALAGSARVAGTDISLQGLRILRVTLDLEAKPAHLVRCRHDALPFGLRTFAAAIAVQSIQDGPLSAGLSALRELHGALRRDAVVFVRVPARGRTADWRSAATEEEGTVRYTDGPKSGLVAHHFTATELTDMADEAGFDVIEGPTDTTAPRVPPLVGRLPYLDVVLRPRTLKAV